MNIKGFWNRGKTNSISQNNKGKEPMYSPSVDDQDDRNFEIDLQNLWKYDTEELIQFIHKYERCLAESRKRQMVFADIAMLKDKLEITERERKRLSEENTQYKLHIENLQEIIDEQSKLAASATTTNSTAKKNDKNEKSETQKDSSPLNTDIELLIEEVVYNRVKFKHLVDDVFMRDVNESIGKLFIDLLELKKQLNVDQETKSTKDTENNEQEIIEHTSSTLEDNTAIEKKSKFNPNNVMAFLATCDSSIQYIVKKLSELVVNLSNAEQETIVTLKDEILSIAKKYFPQGNNDDIKISNEIKNKNEKLEKSNNELKTKHDNLEKSLKDLKEDNSRLTQNVHNLTKSNNELKDKLEKSEKSLKEMKEIEKILNETLLNLRQELHNLNNINVEFKQRAEKAEKAYKDIELERNNLNEQVIMLKQNYSDFANKQKASNDLKNEIDNLMKQMATLIEEKNKIEDKKRDLENKVIQERLKNDQKQRDFSKLEENYKEARENLAQQIEITKEKSKKFEILEADLLATKKKMKDYKKLSKQSKLQILELEKNLKEITFEKQNLETLLKEKSDEINSKLNQDDEEKSNKDLELNQKLVELRELKETIETLNTKNEELVKKCNDIEAEKAALLNKYNILQEKREAGIKEIQKLNAAIEGLKSGFNSPAGSWNIPSPAYSQTSKTEIQTPKTTKESEHYDSFNKNKFPVYQQSKFSNPNNFKKINQPSISSAEASKIIAYIKDVKKVLDFLYRELIDVITSEEFEDICATQKESSFMSKMDKDSSMISNTGKKSYRGSMGSYNTIPNRFIRLEKKVNDTILDIQDYITTLEDRYMV